MKREQQRSSVEDQQEQVDVPCLHCGGVTAWKLLQTLNRCEYCGSVLHWPYPDGEPEYFVAESRMESDDDLIDVLATYDAMREASLRRGQMKSSSDYDRFVDLGSGFSDTEAYEIKEKRKHLFRVQESYRIYVPYLLFSTTIVFHVLGRVSNGSRKIFRSMFFTADDILPAYPAPWDFRDKGLQLSRQRLTPFSGEMQKRFQFLAPARLDVDKQEFVKQWKKQRKLLTVEIDPISFEAGPVEFRRWLVFRPYYFVRALTPDGPRWFLLDGQFGTIAGTPKPAEIMAVQQGKWKTLDVKTIRPLGVHIIPFRCPNCGWDVEMNTETSFQICGNCTRILETTGRGLETCQYRSIGSVAWKSDKYANCVWLPYWYCTAGITQNSKSYQELSALMNDLMPRTAVTLAPQGNAFYIPAFESWIIDRYDQWSFGIGAYLSQQRIPPIAEQPLYHSTRRGDSVVLPSISKDLIPELFPGILPLFLPSNVQFRLSTLIVNRLAQSQVHIKDLVLVYVPAPLVQFRNGEPRVAGPTEAVDWLPLKTGQYPLALHRSVRRWKAMSDSSERSIHPKEKSWLITPL